MSEGINNNSGVNFIKSILDKLGVNSETVSSADVASIFSLTEDSNGNGEVDKSEFIEAISEYYNTEIDLASLENEFVDSWNEFSGSDGYSDTLSYNDLTKMNEQSANILQNSDKNYVNNENYTAPQKQNTVNSTIQAVSTDSLSGQSSSELTAERSSILQQINDLRSQKENNEAVNNAKADVEAKKAAYDEALKALENDDIKNENEKSLNDLKTEKSENDTLISNQKGVIDGLKDSISSQHTIIDSIKSEISSLTAPSEDDYKTTDEEGNEVVDKEAYNEAKSNYEAKKAALEKSLKEAEKVLAQLEENLAEAENGLAALEEQGTQLDSDIQELTQTILSQDQDNSAAKAVNDALEAYNQAKEVLETTEQEQIATIDADISQLQENLSAYDEAITIAEQKEAEEAKTSAGFVNDGRILQDEDGNFYVETEPSTGDASNNSSLNNIIDNSYDFDALGVSSGEAKDKLLEAILSENNISDPNAVTEGQKIVLPNPYLVLELQREGEPIDTISVYGENGTSIPIYNPDGSLASETIEYESGASEIIQYTYDENGNKTAVGSRFNSAQQEVTKYTSEYDEDGNIIVKEGEYYNSDGTTMVNYRWEYNDDNTAILKKWGGSSESDTTETNPHVYDVKFDENGAEIERTETIEDENGRITTFGHYSNIGAKIDETEYTYRGDTQELSSETTTQYDPQTGYILSRTEINYNEDGSTSTYNITYENNIEFSRTLVEKDKDNNIVGEYSISIDPDTGEEVRTPINGTGDVPGDDDGQGGGIGSVDDDPTAALLNAARVETVEDEDGRITGKSYYDENDKLIGESSYLYDSETQDISMEQTIQYNPETGDREYRHEVYYNDDGSTSTYNTTFDNGKETDKVLIEKDADNNVTGRYKITMDPIHFNEIRTPIDENGNMIDEQGRLIDEQGRLIDEQGRLIDEQGRLIDDQGRLIDEDGNLVDENGNIISEGEYQITDENALSYVAAVDQLISDIDALQDSGMSEFVYEQQEKFTKEILPNLLSDKSISVRDKAEIMKKISDYDSTIMTNYLSLTQYPHEGYNYMLDIMADCNSVEEAVYFSKTFETIYDDEYASLSGYMTNIALIQQNTEDALTYMNSLATLYQKAKSSEDYKLLNETFDLSNTLYNLLIGDHEAEFVSNFISIIDLPESSENYTELADWQIDAYASKYSSAKSIVEAVNNGKLDQSTGMYLITQLNGGDLSAISSDIASLDKNDLDLFFDMCTNDYSKKYDVNTFNSSIITDVQGTSAQKYATELSQTIEKIEWYKENGIETVEYGELLSYRKELLYNTLNDSSVTVDDKIKILNDLSEYDNIFLADYYKTLYQYESLSATMNIFNDCNSVDQLVCLANVFEKIYQGTDVKFSDYIIANYKSTNSDEQVKIVEKLISLYDNASQEEILELNNNIDVPNILQSLLSRNTETKQLEALMQKLFNNENVAKIDSSSLGLEDIVIEKLPEKYPDTKSILKALANNDISEKVALYLLQQMDVSEVVKSFRDMWAIDEEKYLPLMLDLFGKDFTC